jgi:hypothetical protein
MQAKYEAYVSMCLQMNRRPLGYLAWAHLQPLAETEL